jgi:hypothetical protein
MAWPHYADGADGGSGVTTGAPEAEGFEAADWFPPERHAAVERPQKRGHNGSFILKPIV